MVRVDPLGFNSDKNEQAQKIHFGFVGFVHSGRANTFQEKAADISNHAFAKGEWCLFDISHRAPFSAVPG